VTDTRTGLRASVAATLLDTADASLLDLVDNLLDKGVVLDAELVLGLAGVDLVYVRLAALLAAADRVPGDDDRN
jgi:gas vesicle structural protein